MTRGLEKAFAAPRHDNKATVMSAAEIEAYWASGEPQDKAGGYAIQGLGSVFVSGLNGSYSAVVGLPVCETAQLLGQFGIPCWQNLTVR